MGRNPKFNADRQEAFLMALRKGLRLTAAAEAVGMTYQGVLRYIKLYPDFRREMDEAEAQACDVIENALYEKARAGNVTAMEIWLFNRRKDRWSDRRNITVQTTTGTEVKTVAELKSELATMLEESKRAKG
jgi:hypothetical protein